jgi:Galactosyltransferase
MNQLLVAVKSCHRDMDAGAHDAIRATWGQALRDKAHVKFFVGKETDGRTHRNYKGDEVVVDSPDHYEGLVWKTRAICQYVVGKAIDHVLMVDTDCCVSPKKLEKAHYAVADYAGIFNGGWGIVGPREVMGLNGVPEVIEKCYSWASGAGYFLSRRAAFEIADASPKASKYIIGSYEDLWVGQVLGPLCASGEMFSIQLDERVCEYYLANGHSKGYDPKSNWMEEAWKRANQ